jgi:glyoxylase-like metal-dependent hydrolase (beta-lactamase superfamily II)|tara:strand:+ start:15326 stop:15979 length:654 start_codon:yes stop_codon:yes gene_type:complete
VSLKEINIKQIPNGKWKENCYIINNNRKDALLIDPGGDEISIIDFIVGNNLNVEAIINTHAHYDHIGAISRLKKKFSIPFFLHSKDEKLLKTANLYVKLFDGDGTIKIPAVDHYLDKIDIQKYITVFPIKVLFTPGHTWGSVCILIHDKIFTGDTLFNERIGRVDLPGGDKLALEESLKTLSKLPGNICIYPGHGTSSTIRHELEYNKNFSQALKWA